MSYKDLYALERMQRAKNVAQALWFAKNSAPYYVAQETGEALGDVLGGILPGMLTALVVVAAGTFAGVTAGALLGGVAGLGVGAAPGAVAGGTLGFSAGMWILEWMGIAFLAVHVGQGMWQVSRLLEQGFHDVWGRDAQERSARNFLGEHPCHHPRWDRSVGSHSNVMAASEKFARAVAVLVRLVLEGIVSYLSVKGVSKLPELVGHLKRSRLGDNFAVWVEKHHQELMCNPKLKRSSGGGASSRPARVLATGKEPLMRINELKALKSNLLQVIQKYEGKGFVLPSCITDLKNFLRLVEMPDFETVIGEDPDTPCWKYVLDGGLDQYPDLRDAFEEFTAELKGFRS